MSPEQMEIERGRFEAFHSDQGQWPKAVERKTDGGYKLMQCAESWRVWLAAKADAQPVAWPIAPPSHKAGGWELDFGFLESVAKAASKDFYCTIDPEDVEQVLIAALKLCPLFAMPQPVIAPISRAEWIAQAKQFYIEAGDDEKTALDCARYICDQQDWASEHGEINNPRDEAQEDVHGRGRPAAVLPDAQPVAWLYEMPARKGQLGLTHVSRTGPDRAFNGAILETGTVVTPLYAVYQVTAVLIDAQPVTMCVQDGTHPDDAAVDSFAVELKSKLAKARANGRGGWDLPECTQQRLSDMLREHVEKGDPRDVANFCLFLWARKEAISSQPVIAQTDAQPVACQIDNTELGRGWDPHPLERYAEGIAAGYPLRLLYAGPQPVIAPEPTNAEKERAVIEAAKEWSAERMPTDWAECDLMKAVATLDGDWAGCQDCDHECDEPCMPATVVQMHGSIDACLKKQDVKKAKEAAALWAGIEAMTVHAKQAAAFTQEKS